MAKIKLKKHKTTVAIVDDWNHKPEPPAVVCAHCCRKFVPNQRHFFLRAKLENYAGVTIYEGLCRVIWRLNQMASAPPQLPREDRTQVFCRICTKNLGNMLKALESFLPDDPSMQDSIVLKLLPKPCNSTDANGASLPIGIPNAVNEKVILSNASTQTDPLQANKTPVDLKNFLNGSIGVLPQGVVHESPVRRHIAIAMQTKPGQRDIRDSLTQILRKQMRCLLTKASLANDMTSPDDCPDWEHVFQDLRRHAPFVLTALAAISSTSRLKGNPKVGAALCILANARRQYINRFQKYISCRLLESQANVDVFKHLNTLGICTSYITACRNLKRLFYADGLPNGEGAAPGEPPSKKFKVITYKRFIKPPDSEEPDDQRTARNGASDGPVKKKRVYQNNTNLKLLVKLSGNDLAKAAQVCRGDLNNVETLFRKNSSKTLVAGKAGSAARMALAKKKKAMNAVGWPNSPQTKDSDKVIQPKANSVEIFKESDGQQAKRSSNDEVHGQATCVVEPIVLTGNKPNETAGSVTVAIPVGPKGSLKAYKVIRPKAVANCSQAIQTVPMAVAPISNIAPNLNFVPPVAPSSNVAPNLSFVPNLGIAPNLNSAPKVSVAVGSKVLHFVPNQAVVRDIPIFVVMPAPPFQPPADFPNVMVVRNERPGCQNIVAPNVENITQTGSVKITETSIRQT